MRHPLTIAALFLTSACAPVGPDFVRPDVELQPEWLESELEAYETTQAELVEWWKVLEDPVLDDLIEAALAQNNNLKIAGLRVLESQAALNIALGNRYPQAQVALGDATAVGTSENASPGGSQDFVQTNLGASASWEIDFWGRFRRGIEAADAQLLASIASYDDLLVLLTAQVADTYAALRAIEEQLKLARDSADIQQNSFDIVQVLYRNGESSELDALQARTQLIGTLATIPNLELQLKQTENALAALLGMAPADMTDILGGEGRLPDLPDTIAIGVPADLLRQRPDVRQAELNALASNALVGVAEADLYPSFSLNGFLGLSANDEIDGNLFSSDSLTYSAGAAFVWPFLNYGRIENNIRVQDARLQQALIQYRETVIQAAREAENAMVSLTGTRQQDELLGEGVATARRSAEISLLRYQEGFADYQRVLDSQQALFTQQQRYAANRGAVLQSLIAVYRSLGGGWQTSTRPFVDEATKREMQERTNWGDVLDTPPTNDNP